MPDLTPYTVRAKDFVDMFNKSRKYNLTFAERLKTAGSAAFTKGIYDYQQKDENESPIHYFLTNQQYDWHLKNENADEIPQQITLFTSPGVQEKIMNYYGYQLVPNITVNSPQIAGVKSAVKRFKDRTGKMPYVYQYGESEVDRQELKPVFYRVQSNKWYGNRDKIFKGVNNFPSQVYLSRDGKLYQSAWDLGDYGTSGTYNGIAEGYSSIQQKLANTLDKKGNITVVYTPPTQITHVMGSKSTAGNIEELPINTINDLMKYYYEGRLFKGENVISNLIDEEQAANILNALRYEVDNTGKIITNRGYTPFLDPETEEYVLQRTLTVPVKDEETGKYKLIMPEIKAKQKQSKKDTEEDKLDAKYNSLLEFYNKLQ